MNLVNSTSRDLLITIKDMKSPGDDDEISDKMIDLESSPRLSLESFYDQLVTDISSPQWERRHGAASALREVISKHGDSGGRVQGVSLEENERRHGLWLEDLLVRLLVVSPRPRQVRRLCWRQRGLSGAGERWPGDGRGAGPGPGLRPRQHVQHRGGHHGQQRVAQQARGHDHCQVDMS